MVEPHSSNFRVIITNFLGVGIFRKFTVHCLPFSVHLLGTNHIVQILEWLQQVFSVFDFFYIFTIEFYPSGFDPQEMSRV